MAGRFEVGLRDLDRTVNAFNDLVSWWNDIQAVAEAHHSVLDDAWDGDAKDRFDEVFAKLSGSLAALTLTAGDLGAIMTAARGNYAAAATANATIWTGSEPEKIQVTPAAYDDAATAFREQLLVVFGAHIELDSVVNWCGSMGGDDDSGRKWAAGYDAAVKTVIGNLGIVIDQLDDFESLLQLSGENHAAADDASRIAGIPSSPTVQAATPGRSLNVPPSAVGGTGSGPDGWEWIRDIGGFVWPNADTGKMNDAAEAWSALGLALLKVTETLGPRVDELVRTNRSAESNGISATWTNFSEQIAGVRTDCDNLSASCADYAKGVDDAHNELVGAVAEWLALEAITLAIGLGLTPFTFGASDAGAAALMSAEVGLIIARAKKALDVLERVADAAIEAVEQIQAATKDKRNGGTGSLTRVVGTEATAVTARVIPINALSLSESGRTLLNLAMASNDGLESWLSRLTEAQRWDAYWAYVARKRKEKKPWRDYPGWMAANERLHDNIMKGSRFEAEQAKDLGIAPSKNGPWYKDNPPVEVPGGGTRKPDLFDPVQRTAYEFKSGSGGKSAAAQLEKDEKLVNERGWTITWIVTGDFEPNLLKELENLSEKYPGKFYYKVV